MRYHRSLKDQLDAEGPELVTNMFFQAPPKHFEKKDSSELNKTNVTARLITTPVVLDSCASGGWGLCFVFPLLSHSLPAINHGEACPPGCADCCVDVGALSIDSFEALPWMNLGKSGSFKRHWPYESVHKFLKNALNFNGRVHSFSEENPLFELVKSKRLFACCARLDSPELINDRWVFRTECPRILPFI